MKNTYILALRNKTQEPILIVKRPYNDICGTLIEFEKAYIWESKKEAEKTRHERRKTRNEQQKKLLTTNQ